MAEVVAELMSASAGGGEEIFRVHTCGESRWLCSVAWSGKGGEGGGWARGERGEGGGGRDRERGRNANARTTMHFKYDGAVL